MMKWVYYTQKIPSFDLDRILDEAGERAWELAALTALPSPKSDPNAGLLFLAVFKQPDISEQS